MVIADIIKRWQVLLGNDAHLLTGTDEHGMKVKITLYTRLGCLLTVAPDSASCPGGWDGYTSLLRHELQDIRGMHTVPPTCREAAH